MYLLCALRNVLSYIQTKHLFMILISIHSTVSTCTESFSLYISPAQKPTNSFCLFRKLLLNNCVYYIVLFISCEDHFMHYRLNWNWIAIKFWRMALLTLSIHCPVKTCIVVFQWFPCTLLFFVIKILFDFLNSLKKTKINSDILKPHFGCGFIIICGCKCEGENVICMYHHTNVRFENVTQLNPWIVRNNVAIPWPHLSLSATKWTNENEGQKHTHSHYIFWNESISFLDAK